MLQLHLMLLLMVIPLCAPPGPDAFPVPGVLLQLLVRQLAMPYTASARAATGVLEAEGQGVEDEPKSCSERSEQRAVISPVACGLVVADEALVRIG